MSRLKRLHRLKMYAEGQKKIRYESRKLIADARPRHKGRFTKDVSRALGLAVSSIASEDASGTCDGVSSMAACEDGSVNGSDVAFNTALNRGATRGAAYEGKGDGDMITDKELTDLAASLSQFRAEKVGVGRCWICGHISLSARSAWTERFHLAIDFSWMLPQEQAYEKQSSHDDGSISSAASARNVDAMHPGRAASTPFTGEAQGLLDAILTDAHKPVGIML